MGNPEDDGPDPDDDVTPSEAATYAFCAKAWHLEHVLGRAASPRAVLRREQGIRQHEQHGERVAARMSGAAWRLAVVLGLALLLLLAIVVVTVLLVRRT